jgi:hypothetical protein
MKSWVLARIARLPQDIATFVNVERQIIQDFIGTVPWDHRPLVAV